LPLGGREGRQAQRRRGEFTPRIRIALEMKKKSTGLILFVAKQSNLYTRPEKITNRAIKLNIMKRKIAGLALLAIIIASVTSGCIVREGYGYHHYHHEYRHW
jgi:hypothetical protein